MSQWLWKGICPSTLGAREGEKPCSGLRRLSRRVLTRASPPFQVFCDMETSGGGWTIIQRRKSGLVSFYRDWKQYKQGFGSIRGDFWLGNDHIHRLSRRPTRLRVEMQVSTRRSPQDWTRAATPNSAQLRGVIPIPFHHRLGYLL